MRHAGSTAGTSPASTGQPVGWEASFEALGLRVEIHLGVPVVAEVSGDVDIATAPWLRDTLLLADRADASLGG